MYRAAPVKATYYANFDYGDVDLFIFNFMEVDEEGEPILVRRTIQEHETANGKNGDGKSTNKSKAIDGDGSIRDKKSGLQKESNAGRQTGEGATNDQENEANFEGRATTEGEDAGQNSVRDNGGISGLQLGFDLEGSENQSQMSVNEINDEMRALRDFKILIAKKTLPQSIRILRRTIIFLLILLIALTGKIQFVIVLFSSRYRASLQDRTQQRYQEWYPYHLAFN